MKGKPLADVSIDEVIQERTLAMNFPLWVGGWLRYKRKLAGISIERVAARLKLRPITVKRRESRCSSYAIDDLPYVLAAYNLTMGQFMVEVRRAFGKKNPRARMVRP